MAKQRIKKNAQLRRRDRPWTMEEIDREIKTAREGRKVAMLSPLVRSRRSMEREHPDVLCGFASKGDYRKRSRRNSIRGMAAIRARKAIAYKREV